MFSNIDFGFKLAVIGIPVVFLSLGIIAVMFELLKRKFRVKEIETEKVESELISDSSKELIAVAAAAAYALIDMPKETLKFQAGLKKEYKETSIPIWNLAGRIELISSKGGKWLKWKENLRLLLKEKLLLLR